MLVEYRDVYRLVENPAGWSESNVKINFDPTPTFTPELSALLEEAKQRTREIRVPLGDFNAPKVAVRKLLIEGNYLVVDTYLTEYFVLWGFPGVAPQFHQQALNDLHQNKTTEIPMGISTHNVVLITPNGRRSSEDIYVAMVVNDSRHGFAPGRLSVSYEGQMDPSIDLDSASNPSTFVTVLRTLKEEFGIGLEQSRVRVSPEEIRLIAVCGEKGSAYTSWCHAVWVQTDLEDLVTSYQRAPRRRDADALLAVPLNKIDIFTRDLISGENYGPFLKASSLTGEPDLRPHPTVPWRVDALKDYIVANHII